MSATLCLAYDIDYEKLIHEASKILASETRITEMVQSQLHLLLSKMRYENSFDLEKLKKELRNEH